VQLAVEQRRAVLLCHPLSFSFLRTVNAQRAGCSFVPPRTVINEVSSRRTKGKWHSFLPLLPPCDPSHLLSGDVLRRTRFSPPSCRKALPPVRYTFKDTNRKDIAEAPFSPVPSLSPFLPSITFCSFRRSRMSFGSTSRSAEAVRQDQQARSDTEETFADIPSRSLFFFPRPIFLLSSLSYRASRGCFDRTQPAPLGDGSVDRERRTELQVFPSFPSPFPLFFGNTTFFTPPPLHKWRGRLLS